MAPDLPFVFDRLGVQRGGTTMLDDVTLTIAAGAIMLLSTNYALSGTVGWTPGGYSIAFARMLQDGLDAEQLGRRGLAS